MAWLCFSCNRYCFTLPKNFFRNGYAHFEIAYMISSKPESSKIYYYTDYSIINGVTNISETFFPFILTKALAKFYKNLFISNFKRGI